MIILIEYLNINTKPEKMIISNTYLIKKNLKCNLYEPAFKKFVSIFWCILQLFFNLWTWVTFSISLIFIYVKTQFYLFFLGFFCLLVNVMVISWQILSSLLGFYRIEKKIFLRKTLVKPMILTDFNKVLWNLSSFDIRVSFLAWFHNFTLWSKDGNVNQLKGKTKDLVLRFIVLIFRFARKIED